MSETDKAVYLQTVAELQNIERHHKALRDEHARCAERLASKDAEIRVLRDALKLMLSPVTHLSGCLWLKNKTMPCQCGFNDRINSAVAAARAALSTAPEGEKS